MYAAIAKYTRHRPPVSAQLVEWGAQLQRKGKLGVFAPSDCRGSGRRKNGFFYTCPKENP